MELTGHLADMRLRRFFFFAAVAALTAFIAGVWYFAVGASLAAPARAQQQTNFSGRSRELWNRFMTAIRESRAREVVPPSN